MGTDAYWRFTRARVPGVGWGRKFRLLLRAGRLTLAVVSLGSVVEGGGHAWSGRLSCGGRKLVRPCEVGPFAARTHNAPTRLGSCFEQADEPPRPSIADCVSLPARRYSPLFSVGVSSGRCCPEGFQYSGFRLQTSHSETNRDFETPQGQPCLLADQSEVDWQVYCVPWLMNAFFITSLPCACPFVSKWP